MQAKSVCLCVCVYVCVRQQQQPQPQWLLMISLLCLRRAASTSAQRLTKDFRGVHPGPGDFLRDCRSFWRFSSRRSARVLVSLDHRQLAVHASVHVAIHTSVHVAVHAAVRVAVNLAVHAFLHTFFVWKLVERKFRTRISFVEWKQVEQSSDNRSKLANCPRTYLWIDFWFLDAFSHL